MRDNLDCMACVFVGAAAALVVMGVALLVYAWTGIL